MVSSSPWRKGYMSYWNLHEVSTVDAILYPAKIVDIGWLYSGLYLKRRSHTNFNSYVVGTERETKDLHSKLSLRIRSRARHTVKSPKKERDDGLQANWYYEIISWKPVHLKSPIGFKCPYLLIRLIRCMGFYNAKQQQSNIWELLFWLGQIACHMSPNPKTNQKPITVPPHISVNNSRSFK